MNLIDTVMMYQTESVLSLSQTDRIRHEIAARDGCRCSVCAAGGGGMVFRKGRISRVSLDLMFIDGDPGNLGYLGNRPNVALACQWCNNRHGMDALERKKLAETADRKKAEREAEFGPELPLWG